MSDLEERIRARAYKMWEDEGSPEGRELAHWDMATELVAIEDNQRGTLKQVKRDPEDPEVAGDSSEPTAPAANMGDVPTLADEGEQIYPPGHPQREG